MLLRKQSLTQNAKRAFGVLVDPFGDLEAVEDMWISQDLRYVREAMFQIAKFGGLLAIIGESGAGKSTLRRDLCCRLVNEPIIVVQPYVIAAEENDTKGKTLKSTHIAEALLAAVAPTDKIKNSPQARFAQLHKALIDSHKSGYRHCLLLEEAHSLPIATLKHLKRIMELEHGFKKLVSVMLIGQPELKAKLSERNAEVREVVQRCEVVELLPIEPKQLKSFLEYRFKRIGIDVGKVINDQGIDAIAKRLVSRDKESQLYPLAVGNFLISAMNLAAQLGEKVVNAEVVQGV